MSLDAETLEYLDRMKESIKTDMKENTRMLVEGYVGIAEIHQEYIKTQFKITHEKQDETNGKVKGLLETTSLLKWMMNNKITTLFILIIFWLLLDWTSEAIDYKKTLAKKAGIELKSENANK